MNYQTRNRLRSSQPPPVPHLEADNASVRYIQDQVSGSRRPPTPPPLETPTRLRPRIKPTNRDTGLVQQAGNRQARLADAVSVIPEATTLQPPSHSVAVVERPYTPPIGTLNANIDPVLLTESSATPSFPLAPLSSDNTVATNPESRAPTPTSDLTRTAAEGQAGEACEPLPSIQSDVPLTHIPPTPENAIGDAELSVAGINEEDTFSQDREEPSTPTTGRRPAAVNAILEEGYTALENILTNLINNTSLSPQQILDGWHKSKARVINATNHWNLYARYLNKHEEQEKRRLDLPADVPGTFSCHCLISLC